jgi:hypothetical protein
MKKISAKKLFISFILAIAIGQIGCGKKTPESKHTISDFEHPSPQLLQDIASKQSWQIENVEARDRAFNALEANQEPADKDWQLLVKAADTEKNGFDLSLAMEFSRHMTDKYRGPVLKWCERNMSQTNDPDAAVLGYACYIRSGGGDKDLWASQLKARGQYYAEKIAEADKRVEARKKPVP